MIAALMLYSLAVTLLFGVAAAAAEQVLRLARRPARIVWVMALLAAVGFAAARFVSGLSPSEVDANGWVTRRLPNDGVLYAKATTNLFLSSAVVAIGSTDTTPPTRKPTTVATGPNATSIPVVSGSAVTRLDRPLTVAWITLSLIGLGIIVLSALRLSRPRRRWATTVVDGVPVFVSHDLGPAVVGVLRYRIVVPAWVLELASRERDLILAHEREHATAGDPALLVMATVLLALMPWNVALWWMGRRLRFAIELDCDARVLHACPDAIAYGSLLLDVSERTLGGAMPITALAEPASLTERRIAAMTARLPRFAGLRAIAAGAMAVVLVVVACATPHPASTPAPDTNQPAASRGDSPDASTAARANAQLSRQIDSLRQVIASMSSNRSSVGGPSIDGLAQPVPVLCVPHAAETDEINRARGDSLRAIALRLHPDAIAPEKHNAFVVVGLVFDSSCRLVKHAVGEVPGRGYVDATLARLIPDMPSGPNGVGGLGRLGPLTAADSVKLAFARLRNQEVDVGEPWVVWTIKRSDRSSVGGAGATSGSDSTYDEVKQRIRANLQQINQMRDDIADSHLRSRIDTMGPHVVIGGAGGTAGTVMRDSANWAQAQTRATVSSWQMWSAQPPPAAMPASVTRFRQMDRRVLHACGIATQFYPSAFAIHTMEHDLIVLVFDSTGMLVGKGMKSRAPLAPREHLVDRDVLKLVMPNVTIDSFFEWGLANISTTEQDPSSGVTVLFAFTGRAPW